MKKEERVASYTHMSPKILLLALNYHYESGENLDFYQKFDLECLLEALEIGLKFSFFLEGFNVVSGCL